MLYFFIHSFMTKFRVNDHKITARDKWWWPNQISGSGNQPMLGICCSFSLKSSFSLVDKIDELVELLNCFQSSPSEEENIVWRIEGVLRFQFKDYCELVSTTLFLEPKQVSSSWWREKNWFKPSNPSKFFPFIHELGVTHALRFGSLRGHHRHELCNTDDQSCIHIGNNRDK